METQEAVAESTPMETDGQSDAKRDGQQKFTLGPNDSLEGKLTYGGHMTVNGGHAEGEFRIGGNIEIGNGTVVKALLEASNVNIKGEVEGRLTARDKLTLGKQAKLNGDVQVRRLQIEDGASLNGYVRMGDFEQQAPGS
ncbi:MAG TPA: polymer-forming cytoskeletal protein [Methylomirabilota bacterium]|nr:polymer-forming cytoskeletal protein [Methylomirabilota bacterium]HXL78655.1 polymer-forming cytoskeletal protein [Candidatus Eisenbacteria bacterium]